jgi:hypothetical protein
MDTVFGDVDPADDRDDGPARDTTVERLRNDSDVVVPELVPEA